MDFVKQFETKIEKTIKKYKLLNKKDKILVACSGGKDSITVLYLLNKFGYNVEGLIIDLLIGNWSKQNFENVQKFCKKHKIKLHVINIREEFGYSICYIRSGIQAKVKLNNCTICGVIKRYLLNKKSRELKADRLVTGHNLDDEAENLLMNILKGNPQLSINLGPKTGSLKDKKFIDRVKPLYFCTNDEVKKYSKLMKFPVLYKPCPCAVGVFRKDVKELLEKQSVGVKNNLVNNFLEILPDLKEKYRGKSKLKYCKICKEPSRNEICKTCKLIKLLA